MMKKVGLIIILIVLAVLNLVAAEVDERIWYYRDTGSYNIQIIDLSKTFYLPKYGTQYNKTDGASGTPENGTYGKLSNGIGNVGLAFNTHKIKFTVSTDGRFVSQSDATKYRDFYIALKPRMRTKEGTDDENSYWDDELHAISSETRVPNTRDSNSVSVIAPKQIRHGNVAIMDFEGKGDTNVLRMYWDILICMDELTSEDLAHLKSGDDYIATIAIEYECMEGANCDKPEKHNGSFVFVINGYYDSPTPAKEEIFLLVNPAPDVMDLDIVNIVNTEGEDNNIHVADIEMYAVTKENYDWANSINFFLSASDNPTVANTDGFRLLNRDAGFYIPFTVTIDNYDVMTWTKRTGVSETKTFDGTDTSSSGNKVNISSAVHTIKQKNGTTPYKSVVYGGKAFINIDTKAYTDPRYYDKEIAIDYVGIDDEQNIYREFLSGVYTSTIYYYIIYN